MKHSTEKGIIVSENALIKPPGRNSSAPEKSSGSEKPNSAHADGLKSLNWLDPQRFSGLYLAILLIVIFSFMLPDTFGNLNNARVIAGSAAIAGIVTLAATVSMAAGTFDISLAATMTFSICLLGLFITEGIPWLVAILLTIAAGALIGAINALIITRIGVESIVATLGMSSVLAGLSFWVAGGQTVLLDDVSSSFTAAGQATIASIPITVFYLFGIALFLWYLLEHTPTGRYIYAIGANPQAAKLAGIRVVRLQAMALMLTGALAATAGVVLTMQLGAASFGAGAPYLLSAFAAAFLGSTQIMPGRFNVRGTIVGLYLLAIAVKGLQLEFSNLPWIKDFVEGLVLIIAVSFTARVIKRRRVS